MRLYTVNEIIEDIYQFEDIRVRLELEPKESYFFKLYSKYYSVKTNGSATIEEFNAKLDRYIDQCSICGIDQPPTGNYRFTLYVENENILKRFAEYSTEEESVVVFSKILPLKNKIFKYDNVRNEFDYINISFQKGE